MCKAIIFLAMLVCVCFGENRCSTTSNSDCSKTVSCVNSKTTNNSRCVTRSSVTYDKSGSKTQSSTRTDCSYKPSPSKTSGSKPAGQPSKK